ncbi:MAG: hypothetical protein QME57_03150, partial [Patescibacteria group bacterium]|nr:hypothetical protein [Patescibacteria group bacterium]
MAEVNVKQLKQLKDDICRHFDVVAEDIKDKIETVSEQVATNTEKITLLQDQVATNTEKITLLQD